MEIEYLLTKTYKINKMIIVVNSSFWRYSKACCSRLSLCTLHTWFRFIHIIILSEEKLTWALLIENIENSNPSNWKKIIQVHRVNTSFFEFLCFEVAGVTIAFPYIWFSASLHLLIASCNLHNTIKTWRHIKVIRKTYQLVRKYTN